MGRSHGIFVKKNFLWAVLADSPEFYEATDSNKGNAGMLWQTLPTENKMKRV